MQKHPTSSDYTDKELVLWEKYYSSMSSDNSIVEQFDSCVLDFFHNFDIKPTSKIKKRRFSLRNKFPEELSNSLYKYISQMNISNSYFDICKYLFNIYANNKEKYCQIAEQAIPHIFRSFFLLIHILKQKIQNIINDKLEATDQLYDLIIDIIPYYIDFFIKLKDDILMDGLYLIELLFHKINHFFPEIIKNITSPYFCIFPKLIEKLLSTMILNQLTTSYSLSPFIEFISKYFYYSFKNDASESKERNSNLITFFSVNVKYCELLKNIFDSSYWALTSFLLTYLEVLSSNFEANKQKEFFSLPMEIMKFLFPFRSISDDQKNKKKYQFINDTSFAKTLSCYVNAFIQNNRAKKDNQIKKTTENKDVTSYLHDIDIFDEFNIDYSKCSSEIRSDPQIKNDFFLPEHSMNMICNQTVALFKNNINFFTEFTRFFIKIEKDNDFLCRIALYCSLIRSFLKNEQEEDVPKLGKILDENHIWPILLSTNCIFEESFIEDESNLQLAEIRFYIFEIIKYFLCDKNSPYKYRIVIELEKLIETHSLHICLGVINYLRSCFQSSPELMPSIVSKDDRLIQTLIQNDRCIKSILLYHKHIDGDNERQLYIQLHYDTFLLIKDICDLNSNDNQVFDYDQSTISYLYSYLFETDENIRSIMFGTITNAFINFKTTQYLIYTLTTIVEQRLNTYNDQNDDFIFEVFSSLIHILIISSQKNPKETIKNMMNCNSIQSLSNIPQYLTIMYSHSDTINNIASDFQLNEENQNNILIIIQYLIQLYTFICKANKSAFKLLNSVPNQEIITGSKNIVKFVKINQSTYEYFLTFLCGKKVYDLTNMENYRIVNFGAINFIYDWTYNTPFFENFLNNLISLAENSLSNCYQLFKCQIKARLLQYILENSKDAIPSAYSLYKLIAESFFSIMDVKDILHIIIQSEKECSTKLLDIFAEILNKDYSKLSNSFFHISGEFDNKLIISKLAIHFPFSVSTEVLFEKNIKNSTFMEISDDSNQISILVDDKENLHLETMYNSEKHQCEKCIPFQTNQWYKFKIQITYDSIELYLNQKLQIKYLLPLHFEFNGCNIKVQFFGEGCNIDDITVNDIKGNRRIASFTAKLLHSRSNKIFNTVESLAKARFNGIYAPYSPRLIESIISCGGPKIILPLFTVVSKANNQIEFLRLLLVTIRTLMKKKEETFMNINFFRIFNHLLSSIPLEEIKNPDENGKSIGFFPLSCSNEIIGIFQSIKNDELLEEMTIYFWSDFALCAKFEHFIPFFYADNLEQLQRWMTIQRCTSSIDHVDSPIYIDILVALLIFMFDKSIDDKVAQFLLTVINMKSIGETCGIIFLQVISHYVQSKNSSMLNALKNTNYYYNFDALIDLANHNKLVNLTLWIIRTFLIICHTISEAKSGLFQALLKVNFVDNEIEIPKEGINELYQTYCVFLFDSENSIYQVPFSSIKLKTEGIKGLRYVQFIPLVCNLFKYLSKNNENEKIIEFVNLIYNVFNIDITNYSQLVINNLPNWSFVFLFLMQNDKPDHMKRWLQIIQIMIKLDIKQLERFISLLYVFCSINQYCYADLLFELLDLLLCQNANNKKELVTKLSNKVIFLIFKLMLFQPLITKQADYNSEFKTDFKIFLKNILEFSPEVKLNLDFYNSSELPNEELSKISNLALLLMNHICNDDKSSKIITYSGESSVTIGYFMVILLSKLMPTKEKVYFEIIKKLLTNSDTDNTFIRIIHLSIVHYFSNNKEYGNKIIQIVKNENSEFKTATKEVILMTSELMLEGFNDSMSKYVQSFPNEFESIIKMFIETITKENEAENQNETKSSNLENYEEVILYYMKTKKYNTKIWNEMYEGMKLEASNVWSAPNLSNHRKYSKRYDLTGRHLFTTRNKIFNNHLDASRSRDEGTNIAAEASFIDYKPIETNKKTILSILNIDCRMLMAESLFIGTLFIESGLKSIIFEIKFYCDPILEETKEIQKMITIDLSTVRFILWRRYHHIDNSIEFIGTKSYFFTFQDNKERQTLLNELEKMKSMFPNIIYIQNKPSIDAFQSLHFTERWKNGEMTNYEYLFLVNMFAGRSYCDLSQYPVFPWLITDYTSPHLDLNNPAIFRDLSKPIGTMNPSRLKELKELKSSVAGTDDYCLYRFHYSTASYVIYFLIRCEPFTTMHINLQKNRFDNPNRLFKSIQETWNGVISISMDFKELIPEFFTFPAFLLNSDNFDLGVISETKERVGDVILPKWAKTASQFIALHRLALESPLASEKIDQWIDLVFGFKQRGPIAEEFLNDFHPFSYSSSIDAILANSKGKIDEEKIAIIQSFAANFGITPEQLFKEKHPRRSNFLALSRNRQISTSSDFKINLSDFVIINGQSVVKISIDDDHIFTIDTKCKLSKYKKIKDKWTFIESFLNFSGIELSDAINEHLAIISSLHLVLISTPWADKFELYKMKIAFVGNSLKPVFSSPKHNSCISVARATLNYVAIGTQNADVQVWDINKCIQHNDSNYNSNSTDSKDQTNEKNNFNITNDQSTQYQNSKLLIGHSSPIVDISIDESMDTIISLDESQLLICFSISTGKQIFSLQLSANVKRVFLSKLGFIIVISEFDYKSSSAACSRRSSSISANNTENNLDEYSINSTQLEMENVTTVSLYDLSGKLIEMSEFSGAISCAELIETIDCSEFLACSFANCSFMLLRVNDLYEVLRIKTPSKISLMAFSKKEMFFLFKLANNNIIKADLAIN